MAFSLVLITTVEYPDVIAQPKDVLSYPFNDDFNGGDSKFDQK